MPDFVVYNAVTGEIKKTGYISSEDLELQAGLGEVVVAMGGVDDSIHKINVLTGGVINKTAVPSSINKTIMNADGIDSIIISNLPNPTRVSIAGEGRWVVDDGVFEFTTDTAGEYEIKLLSSLYISVEYAINAS